MSEPPSPATGAAHRVREADRDTSSSPVPGVQIVDTPTLRVHHPGDLIGLVLSTLAIAAVMLLAVYASQTTAGAAQDVQTFDSLLGRIVTFPVAVLESLVTILVPLAVLVELAVRRRGRQILEAMAAAAVALVLCAVALSLVGSLGSADLVRGLSVLRDGVAMLSIPPFLAALSGLLTTAGPRGRRRTVAWSWQLVWVTVGIVLITGQVSLPGSVVALLLGRIVGLAVKYLSGVQSERAYGAILVDGLRGAGFSPSLLVRVQPDGPEPSGIRTRASASASARASGGRVYELTTTAGEELSVVALDGDRQVIGALSRLWRSLRLRGIEGSSFISLRQAAERAALIEYAAAAAGVRTPRLRAVAEAADSMLLVQGHPGAAVPLRDLDEALLTNALLRGIWDQLRLAHEAGIAHRALTSDTVLVERGSGEPVAWLTGWGSGSVASSGFARRMDLTQMIALLALRVGATRAMESAIEVLPAADLAAIGPLLQTVALPHQTRDEVRAHREVLAELRSALVQRLPEADVEPQRLVRFGARTVVTLILPVVAVVVILTTINVDQISTALATSDWRWSVVAFILSLLTFVGAGLTLVGFSPVRLSLWSATLVHAAGAFVALAAPAGIGSAALNLRILIRRGVTTSLAIATVALVQVSQFVVTIVLLLILSVASGTNDAARFTPSPGVLIAVGVTAAIVAGSLLVPVVRQWVLRRTLPTVRQIWPRLIEVMGHPGKVTLALGGNVALTMGYVFAFGASLAAFGQHLPLVQVALVYLVGNAAGAAVPTPGGLGTIEGTLIFGLTASGINPGVAASAAILFRVVTFWLPIPIGWVALHLLRRKDEI